MDQPSVLVWAVFGLSIAGHLGYMCLTVQKQPKQADLAGPYTRFSSQFLVKPANWDDHDQHLTFQVGIYAAMVPVHIAGSSSLVSTESRLGTPKGLGTSQQDYNYW